MSGKGEEILTEEQQADFLLQTKLRLKSFGFITDDSLEEEKFFFLFIHLNYENLI